MRRIFRAFLWMRWRILINSLERTGARDTLERFSIATEKLGPILALVLLVPASVGLFVLGMTAGFGLGTGAWPLAIEVVRYLLLLALALTLIGPVILPSRDSGAIVRLLLLPIPRVTLYIGQMLGAIADPWILLVVPVVLGVAVGLAVAVKLFAALAALAAGIALLLFVMGLTSFSSSVVHLLLRDRRRGDVVMFVVVLVIPLIAMAPQLLIHSEGRGGRRLTREERAALPPSTAARIATRIAPLVPSEMYRRATIDAATAPLDATLPLAGLAIVAFAVQASAFGLYRRVLDMPVSLGSRRAGRFKGLWTSVIPGLTAGSSAVAFTQLRLALRTPRGRASIATPVLIQVVLVAITYRGGAPLPGLKGNIGLGLATFGLATAILALMPLSLNQFAIDKAGFTRQMLCPLSVRELLWGKAVGNGLVTLMPGLFCLVVPTALFGIRPAAYLVALGLGALATYVVLCPVAAALSAFFPKTVDLNGIGNSSNAHQAAGLLGMLAFAAAAAPSILLAVFASRFLHRPELVPLFLLAWCAAAFGLSYVLFIPAARFVNSRRETLAQYY